MYRTIMSRTLHDRRRSLAGWSVGVVAATVLLAAIWPTIRDMADFQQLIKSYPQELSNLFNIEAMATPAGYLNAEYFSFLAPILFLTFGIGLGARLPAAEEERGSLDVLLALPVPRWRLLLEQAATVVVACAVLCVAQVVALLLSSLLFSMGVGFGQALAVSVSMSLLAALFGLIALTIGALTGRRAVALMVASVLAVGSYLLYVAAQFVSAVEPWVFLSPIEHVVGSEPILNGLPWVASGALAAVAVVVVAAAMPVFTRRDLATA